MFRTCLRRNYSSTSAAVTYKQGQHNQKDLRIREYFYYIDHNGMLFMDDSRMKNFTSSFKDPVFVTFFFRQLKLNPYPDYKNEFPYVSLCGLERNYTRADDLPIVFTKLVGSKLHYGHYTLGDKLSVDFSPEKLEFKSNGRMYHPTFMKPPKMVEKGLIRSQLVMELSSKFIYDGPQKNKAIGIHWDGKEILFIPDTIK